MPLAIGQLKPFDLQGRGLGAAPAREPLPSGMTEASRFYLVTFEKALPPSDLRDPFPYRAPELELQQYFSLRGRGLEVPDELARKLPVAITVTGEEITTASVRRALDRGTWLTSMETVSPTGPRVDDVETGIGPWHENDGAVLIALADVLASEVRNVHGLLRTEVLYAVDLFRFTGEFYVELRSGSARTSDLEDSATRAANYVFGNFPEIAEGALGGVASAAVSGALAAYAAGAGAAGIAAGAVSGASAALVAAGPVLAAAGVAVIGAAVAYVATQWFRGLLGELESTGGTPGSASLERSSGVKFNLDAAERYAHKLWHAVRIAKASVVRTPTMFLISQPQVSVGPPVGTRIIQEQVSVEEPAAKGLTTGQKTALAVLGTSALVGVGYLLLKRTILSGRRRKRGRRK